MDINSRKKDIRCCFVDFWPTFTLHKCFSYLENNYNLIIDPEHPDYLFYSCFGSTHLNYTDCIKIFYSGENIFPDLNVCDYACVLSDVVCGDRIFKRNISFAFFNDNPPIQSDTLFLLNRKFCNFVYGNAWSADPFRVRFFQELSKYKKVDSGGRLLNNIGYQVPIGHKNKITFQNHYKFTLAIENSSLPGYHTEKIAYPFLANSLPLYWGDSTISSVYNEASFVNLISYSSIEEAIEEIIHLDRDDDAYLEKISTPFWLHGSSLENYKEIELTKLLSFFDYIFEQPLELASRRPLYGYAKKFVEVRVREGKAFSLMDNLPKEIKWFARKIKGGK